MALALLALGTVVPGVAAPAMAEDSVPSVESTAGEWTQFRGSLQNGVGAGGDLAASWPEDGPEVLWRRPLGSGYATVIGDGERIYTSFADGDQEFVGAFSPADGKEIWRYSLGARLSTQFGDGPRATPAVEGGAVYALGSDGVLKAVSADSGEELWSASLMGEVGGSPPQWGISSSPVVDGDLLLVETGGGEGKGITAFDAASGEQRWTALDLRRGYSTPVAVTLGGVRQYIVAPTSAPEVVSLLADGSVHWRTEWESGSIASPVPVGEDGIFVSASNDVGGRLLRISTGEGGAPAVEQVWHTREMKNHFSSSVSLDGFIYGFDGGTFKCIDAADGSRRWAKRGLGKGSLIAAGDHLFVLTDRGKLVLVDATPEGYKAQGEIQLFQDKTWTAPVLVDGVLYLRDHTDLVAIDASAG
ncbi:MAG: PQQ-binding-like beta-propeller repeat protein [Acidobacteriota bacterium]